ncbi:MAG: ABC transporter permease [Proteobacteria bacterium]|nr:ABC transporter permease [Pseudomonadota bacterium]
MHLSPRRWPLSAKICVGVLAALALAALVGPWLAPYAPEHPDWNALSSAPSTRHWLGTDAIGRDTFVRCMYGLRLSLLLGFGATAIALVIGLSYGACAGYFGGRVERLLMRGLDVLSALPFLLIVILLLTLFDRSLPLLLAAIGGYVWIDLARVVRAEAARLRELPFVQAARAAGASGWQILRWHIVPNLLGLALVYASLLAAQAILVESFLGFLGLSVDQPSAGLGTLLEEGAQELDSAPWTLLAPALLLVATLASFQQLGDALRDALDVRNATDAGGSAGGESAEVGGPSRPETGAVGGPSRPGAAVVGGPSRPDGWPVEDQGSRLEAAPTKAALTRATLTKPASTQATLTQGASTAAAASAVVGGPSRPDGWRAGDGSSRLEAAPTRTTLTKAAPTKATPTQAAHSVAAFPAAGA